MPTLTYQNRPFDLEQYLLSFPRELFEGTAEYSALRREACRYDPLLFALLYLPHHLESEGEISLSQVHLDFCQYAADTWRLPKARMHEHRDAWVAPREVGKSTWFFLILPLWGAAYGYVRFAAAFADAARQAESHSTTLKIELSGNALLALDFPSLCRSKYHTDFKRAIADSRQELRQENGFIFTARGIESDVLGMKKGNLRPDLIILDDIESGEEKYSAYQAAQRLKTVQDVILPLNSFARSLFVGTVTMEGSIMHQIVKHHLDIDEAEWVKDENLRTHYYPAIVTDDDGNESSIWEEKWPLSELDKIRHTRAFHKNFLNLPLSSSDAYWSPEDIKIKQAPDHVATVLSIDPAVTTKTTSDYTAMAVVGKHEGAVYVRHAERGRWSPSQIREKVLMILDRFPQITLILVETNQGGEFWRELLKDAPCRVKTIHQTVKKEIRAERVLYQYQKDLVFHEKQINQLETEMLAFPHGINDDLVDAVVTGVAHLLFDKKNRKTRARTMNYL